jgi:aromatic-L-amino-acid/L-tryptophan decarboxylase
MREFREFGHKLIDWVADYLESPERYAVLSTIKPDEIVNGLPAHGPEDGETIEHIFEDFERVILPGITHWNNPRFLAYFANTSSPPAILAELLSAALNANGFLWKVSPAVTELEIVTLRWLLHWFGLPQDWFGMILDTASTSTLHALAAARAAIAPETREAGATHNLVLYTSDQAHSSVDKAAITLGFGNRNIRHIACDAEFRMRTDLLEEAIARDREAGLRPCCIVATVGTTATGSVDPVAAIADIADREDLWLHVDAAYAGSAAVAPEFRWVLDGCDRADSLVFNPHKWLMVTVDCSVFYCKHPDTLRHAFSLVPEILRTTDGGLNMMDYGVPLGRRFRSLKLWFVLRYYGHEGLAQIIRDQVEMVREMRDRIVADSRFEICAPTLFSLVCFRLKGSDELNRMLLDGINGSGRFFLSGTILNGRYVLRIAVGNMWTTRATLDELWLLIDALSGDDKAFRDALEGLRGGDFSRLEPLFEEHPGRKPQIIEWHEEGRFAEHPDALAEALTCASFLGRITVVEYLLRQGIDPAAGKATGLDALHWGANRGQLEAVRVLLRVGAPLESRNRYGGTVIAMAVWSAVHEPRPDHIQIIEALLAAGARIEEAGYPTGNAAVDEAFKRHHPII